MSLKISRILHAGYVFECEGTQIAFDPIFENPFSRNCHAFPNVEFDYEKIKKLKFSAVFISHFHDDHCSLDSLNLLDRETPIYIYCLFDELISWIKELGFVQVTALSLNVPIHIGSVEIIPRRALDADVDSIFQIKAAGLNVLNVVDSWIDYETLDLLKQNSPWDMILWPFQTMREIEVIAPSRAEPPPDELPIEWIEQLQALNPRYVVPSSCQFSMEPWSWYNHAFFPISYSQFQKEIEAALPRSQVVRMNPSVSIELDRDSFKASAPLGWVQPVGEQDVDYEFKKDLKPPSTAEISLRFPPLTETQTQKVYEYCQSALLEKYKSMEPPEGSYFEKPRLWRLSIYDHSGVACHFYYRVENDKIEVMSEEAPLAWTTEVSIFKLFAALEHGESLTSMYMRINDVLFEPEVEKEIASADIVEDPLIRCLFTGAFGTYQHEQLKNLRKLNKAVLTI